MSLFGGLLTIALGEGWASRLPTSCDMRIRAELDSLASAICDATGATTLEALAALNGAIGSGWWRLLNPDDRLALGCEALRLLALPATAISIQSPVE